MVVYLVGDLNLFIKELIMRKFVIAPDAFAYILILLALSVVFYFVFIPLAVFTAVLLAFTMFFFRNPERKIPQGDGVIVSPADGLVMSVSEIYENDFLKSKSKKVTIFLSIFNVHINRSPIAGSVAYTAYRPGKFLPAYKTHVSELNERNSIGIKGEKFAVLVHQITGLIARRIVCWSKEGDVLASGERFGLIKFGSCTEVVVPLSTEIKVKPGDKVKGGTTIIGVVN